MREAFEKPCLHHDGQSDEPLRLVARLRRIGVQLRVVAVQLNLSATIN